MSDGIIHLADARRLRAREQSEHVFSLDVFKDPEGHVWATVSNYEPDFDPSGVPKELERLAFWDRLSSDDPAVAAFVFMRNGPVSLLWDNETLRPTPEQAAWMRERFEEALASMMAAGGEP